MNNELIEKLEKLKQEREIEYQQATGAGELFAAQFIRGEIGAFNRIIRLVEDKQIIIAEKNEIGLVLKREDIAMREFDIKKKESVCRWFIYCHKRYIQDQLKSALEGEDGKRGQETKLAREEFLWEGK